MMQGRTIQTFFQKAILRYAGLGLVLLCLVSLAISFLLVRDQMSTDLQESARATAQAFRDRIIDGDIRSVEPQIRQVLQLHNGESAQILKPDFSRIYQSSAKNQKVQKCPNIGISCFDGYFGQARILYPISLDAHGKTPFRYLYISKDVRLNWSFLATVFAVFTLGYFGLVVAFLRVSKLASGRLSHEIEAWSDRLRENPKNMAPLVRPPFSELLPLKEAIEGLNIQIEKYEKTATDKAKLLLLRGIAHDLLTPVARLQLYLATLELNIDKEGNAEVLSEIQDSLKKVTNIASQVKALKEGENSSERTNLVSAAEDEVKALRDSDEIASKALKLEFWSASENVSAPFSKIEISRIISNLVKNAADASPTGSVVNVEVGSANGMAFLSVKDRGCGIPENSKNRVFDPDFTLKPATGTGLGLSIVKYICDQRSAQIDLESGVHQGTTVTIRVPAQERETNV